jgi:SNF2 family DNA or RNA helicase
MIQVTLADDKLIASFPYDRDTVAAVKVIPGRNWDDDAKAWWWRPTPGTITALRRIDPQLSLSPEAEAWAARYDPPTEKRDPLAMTPVDVPEDFAWLAKTPGRPHQRAASAWRRGHGRDKRRHPRCGLEAGLGTGKTLMVIEEIHKLRAAQPEAKVLILAPNSTLRKVWEDQIRDHSSIDLSVCILDGPIVNRKATLATAFSEYDIFVHNHESLGDMGLTLAALPWTLIVLDEHSKFRNHLSVRAKVLLGQGKFKAHPLRAPYQIALSGTPVVKRATDFYVTYKWLGAPTGNIATFREQHCIMGGYQGRQEQGIKPNSGLYEMIDQWRFCIPKGAVLNIPRVISTREVELPPWQRKIYERVREECKVTIAGMARNRAGEAVEIEEVEENLTNHLTVLLRLQEVNAGIESVGEAYNWHARNAKTTYLIEELLPEILDADPQGKVIVWCWFKAEIRHLAEAIRAAGYNPVTYYGEMGQKGKDAAVDEFRRADGANVFVGQAAAAGLGLNLPEARTMVWYTRSFNSEAYMQALDRNYRLDTAFSDLVVIVLEAKDTVDQAVTAVLTRNAILASQVSSVDPSSILDVSRMPQGLGLVYAEVAA